MKKLLLQTGVGILFFFPLYGYAHEVGSSTISTTGDTSFIIEGTSTDVTPVKSFTLCSQEAIENRDTKIASSRTLYNTAMAKALTERKNREKAAVAVTDTDDKKAAIKVSVENYKNQAKAAQNTLTQSRKLAWQTFENDIKKCHELEDEDVSPQDDATSSIKSSAKETIIQKIEEPEKTIKGSIFERLQSFFNN